MANKLVNLEIKLKDGVSAVLKKISNGIANVSKAFNALEKVATPAASKINDAFKKVSNLKSGGGTVKVIGAIAKAFRDFGKSGAGVSKIASTVSRLTKGFEKLSNLKKAH